MEAVTNHHLAIHVDPISLTLDSEGRWRTFRLADRQFRRLVNGHAVELVGDEIHDLSRNAVQGLQAMINHHLKELIIKANTQQVPDESCNISDSDLLAKHLVRASESITDDLDQIEELFLRAYPEPISMLPPDRYRDLVLLPATGCPSTKCTFCTLYTGAGFQIFSPSQFEEHVESVRQLFGNAINEKTGIFLGSASALSLSQRRFTGVLLIIKDKLGSFKRGIASFYDPYHAPKRAKFEYDELRKLGLRQVTIGLESGSGLLRQLWGKSPDLSLLKNTIDTLKASKIQVALTILTGFHAKENYLNHIDDTTTFIRSLPLDHTDILYLSPLDPSPVTESISTEQVHSLKSRLREVTPARVVPYFVNTFRYYS